MRGIAPTFDWGVDYVVAINQVGDDLNIFLTRDRLL
jgi:hypothetical protein